MNGDVTVKTKEGVTVRIPYTTIKKVKLPSKPEESTEEVVEKLEKQEKPAIKESPKTKPTNKK